MAQSKYINETGLAKIFALIAGKYETIENVNALVELLGAAQKGDKETVLARLDALETAVGSDVAQQIKNAVEALDAEITSEDGSHVTVKVTEVDGKITAVNVTESDIASAQDLADEVSAREQAVSDEETRATEAEEALAGRLDVIEGEAAGSIKAAVAAEKERAEGAESDLQDAIDAEEAARKAQIGELGKVSEAEDAADHTVKSFVEAKIAEVNGDAEALEARVEANEGNIETLMGADTVEGSVAKALKDAKEYADGLDEAMDARVDKLEAVHGTKEDGSFKTVAEEAAEATALIVAGADEKYDTLKEIADFILSDTTGAAKMANDISALKTQVGTEADGETAATGLVADIRALEDKVGDGFIALTNDEIEAAFGIVKETNPTA